MLFISSSINANANDSTAFFHYKVLKITGNKITKQHIIEREVVVKRYDSVNVKILPDLIQKSQQNLLNLFLFNKVSITHNKDTLFIQVFERWYLWPIPEFKIVDRNFNVWLQTKDLSRTYYGINFTRYNFRGRNETLKFLFTAGYTQKASLEYKIPNLNKRQTIGIKFTGGFFKNREVWYQTFEDKVKFYNQNKFVINNYEAQVSIKYRPKIYNWHEVSIGYKHLQINGDEVLNLNPLYTFGNLQKECYLNYKFIVDKRNYKGYATRGYYWQNESEIEKLFSTSKSKTNVTFKTRISSYIDFGKNFFLAASTALKWSSFDRLPYTNNKSFGYGYDYVRGYELYVVDGPHFSLTKVSFKYLFLHRKIKVPEKMFAKVKYMPCWGYLTLFSDAGYVNNPVMFSYNKLPNQWLYGYGLSIDGILFHDRIMRIEYTINKLGQRGLYLHFINAI